MVEDQVPALARKDTARLSRHLAAYGFRRTEDGETPLAIPVRSHGIPASARIVCGEGGGRP
eukprot:13424245-Alexandrium_andersonii.AAC.1